LKSPIDSFDDSAAYLDAWIGLQNTYPLLERFVGGLATIFPGTSTVESDFSVVKYEKNKNRMSLTDASLEGILHAKHYRRMHSLKVQFYAEYCLNYHCRIAPNVTFTLRRISLNSASFGKVQVQKWRGDEPFNLHFLEMKMSGQPGCS
jgi:hypothetical protein